MNKISIIAPCYNEHKSIQLFYDTTKQFLSQIENTTYQFVFVNDGSSDDTLAVIQSLNKKDSNVDYISFSRNFGKEAAIYAGLKHAQGDYVVLMDSDLQHPPRYLEMMYNTVLEGYDACAFKRSKRTKENFLKKSFTKGFYKLIQNISETEMVENATDFRMMNRKMVDSILQICERKRYTKGIFSWIGFDVYWLEGEVDDRVHGDTNWSYIQLIQYAMDGIVSFSTKPLFISAILGIILFMISILSSLYIFINTMINGNPTSGWPTLIIVILFFSGIQLFSIGILGQYIATIFFETKNRPIYIVKDSSYENK